MASVELENQTGCCGGDQNNQRDEQRNVDARLDQGTVVTATLPVSSNEGCCSAGITRDEVAGSDRSREIGGLGQVLTLVTTRDHGGVSAGCGCSPDVDALASEEQGQTPLGVDSRDGSPLDFMSSHDVADVDAGLSNNEARSPKCCVDGHGEECGNRDSAQTVDQSTCCGGGCCSSTENQNEHDSEDLAGTGSERGHVLHVVTEVTR